MGREKARWFPEQEGKNGSFGMGADQRAAIRPAIAELENAARNSEGEFIARFDIPGRDARWVEVVLGTVNFAYPFADEPLARLRHYGITPLPELELIEWQPDLFATIRYDSATKSRDVAEFVDCVLATILRGGTEYEVDVEIERLSD